MEDLRIIKVGNVGGGNTQSRSVYLARGICPTLTASMGTTGNTVPYLLEKRMEEIKFLGNTYGRSSNFDGSVFDADGIAPTSRACMSHGSVPEIVDIKFLGSLYGHGTGYAGAVFSQDGLAPTLGTMQGGSRQPMFVEGIHAED